MLSSSRGQVVFGDLRLRSQGQGLDLRGQGQGLRNVSSRTPPLISKVCYIEGMPKSITKVAVSLPRTSQNVAMGKYWTRFMKHSYQNYRRNHNGGPGGPVPPN